MPDMKQQLALLWELQQTDTGIALHRRALRELDDGTNADAGLAAAQGVLADHDGRLRELEGSLRDRELQLKSTEEAQKSRTQQAYGGTVHDAKQLSALEKKIAELGRMKGRLEEEVLELMDGVESAQAAAAKQRKVVDELAARAGGVKERFAAGSSKLKGELKELKKRREELLPQVDGPLLQQYEGLLEKAGGMAVAAVRQGSCTGCKTSLPGAFAQRLRAHDRVVRCDNCRRFLYLPEGESAAKATDDR